MSFIAFSYNIRSPCKFKYLSSCQRSSTYTILSLFYYFSNPINIILINPQNKYTWLTRETIQHLAYTLSYLHILQGLLLLYHVNPTNIVTHKNRTQTFQVQSILVHRPADLLTGIKSLTPYYFITFGNPINVKRDKIFKNLNRY